MWTSTARSKILGMNCLVQSEGKRDEVQAKVECQGSFVMIPCMPYAWKPVFM